MQATDKQAFNPSLRKFGDYLSARNFIIEAREGFFFAIRAHLRPDERSDAKNLSDPLWDSPARKIADEDWIANPARGYLTIRENLASGRSFRLSILQMGKVLRVGVRVPKTLALMQSQVGARISSTFPGQQPIQMQMSTGEVLFDWNFDVPDLYDSALTMETAIYQVGHLFENALQTILTQKQD
ncbi:uncharacterized protein NMK_1990 [Novimethylophilus kurashikiensis]|uniref:Uncharacterized protein n=1 Tax=Novimethylophilus kurashikiensis TaxID=1825523 RepID=A0A2R5FCF7_9PROT|nr:hypothetical protein [Novimethylophilus kurashikiensis]GBG14391.1 uncharacterized protein NMK_1990 [Novimethylophilus kurashikiensis]